MSHGVAKIHILRTPAMAFKLMHHYPMKILVVHSIVRAKCGSIIVIDDTVVDMGRIVCAEVTLLHTQAHEKAAMRTAREPMRKTAERKNWGQKGRALGKDF